MIRYVKIVGLTLAGLAMKLPSCIGAPFPRLSLTDSEEWRTEPNIFQTYETAREMDSHTTIIKILVLCAGVVIIIMLMGYLGKKMADFLLESRKHDETATQKPGNWKLPTSADRYHFQHCSLKMIEEEKATTQTTDPTSVVSKTSSIFENPNITTVLECPGLYGTLGMKESDVLVIRNPLFQKG